MYRGRPAGTEAAEGREIVWIHEHSTAPRLELMLVMISTLVMVICEVPKSTPPPPAIPTQLLQHCIPWLGSLDNWYPNTRESFFELRGGPFQGGGLLQGRDYCYCLLDWLVLESFVLLWKCKYMENLSDPRWEREEDNCEQGKSVLVG